VPEQGQRGRAEAPMA